ncbi:exodeoxyribonuclease VII large subunit [Pelovirga terrestris]|uniref:exodeoxyribonuclease VII large subunit n=1 Tax=Pelovirga terrestris TaxID=2771352 RepID=UPI00307FF36C
MNSEHYNPAVVKVTELVGALQELVEDNFVDVLVQGELSNVSRPTSGHLYFTLKDSSAQIRCAMFRSQARLLNFLPQDGEGVICRGRVSVYAQRGDLQLIVEEMNPEGVGSLQQAFEEVRQRLDREGLFAREKKKPLPAFPQTIGVVTSASGAAFQDILQILRRRAVGVTVLLRPVRVQGVGAAAEIAAGIADLNRHKDVNVMIVGRGGGSKEDLWAFNEEVVARAIAASEVPVISAVGHETDVTIADLVADLRAPTPSSAAELVVQNRLELERHLDQLMLRLGRQMRWQLNLLNSRLDGLKKRLKSPTEPLRQQQQQVAQLLSRLVQGMRHGCQEHHHRLNQLAGRLTALSPTAVLNRGYAIVLHDNQVVVSSRQVQSRDDLRVILAQGQIQVQVTAVTGSDEEDVDPTLDL